jgi:sporulation protein YlmC with PRC-barrel domain
MSRLVYALTALAMVSMMTVANAKEEVFLTTVPESAIPVSGFYKQAVYDVKDEKIGDINDVLMDKSGKVEAVILGVGGFLGLGEKNVAVPFNAIGTKEKDGNPYLVVDTTKEALQSARGYTYDRTKREWVANSDKRASSDTRIAQ